MVGWKDITRSVLLGCLVSGVREKVGEEPRLLGIWATAAISAPLIIIFFFLVPLWIRTFDASLPPIQLGVTKHLGVPILLVGTFLMIVSILTLTRMAGGMPLSRVKGGTPPKLVTTSAYRYVRHPQQLGGFMMLLGLGLYLESLSILVYAGLYIAASHIHVVLVEEPRLKSAFRETYNQYEKAAPRWIPRLWRRP